MKAIINFRKVAILNLFIFWMLPVFGQVTIELTVLSGTAATTCDDGVFGGTPDILWEVNIENQGWVTYPENVVGCFPPPPNLQYTNTVDCFLDVPVQINVCFRAYENDPGAFGDPCSFAPDCLSSICEDFTLPAVGTTENNTLSLTTGASTGSVDFSIAVSQDTSNNLICNATDLGILGPGEQIGDVNAGIYNNLCADDDNDIMTSSFGIFGDDNTVWFTFTTSADVGPETIIELLSDPNNTGDFIDLEVALFQTSDNTCTGTPIYIDQASPINSLNASFEFECVQPSTTYYLVVDGGYFDAPQSLQGVFSLQLTNVAVQEAGDTPCEAEDLGVVPEGGSVSLNGFRSNFCATGAGDIPIPAFGTQSSVWFQFTPPSSGHVLVEAFSEPGGIDPLDIQMAVLRSLNDCNGFFFHLESDDDTSTPDQSLEVSCLYDDVSYYILIDGALANLRGTFTVSVTDAGDITPVEVVDTTICAGEVYSVAGSDYTMSGTYFDTIPIFFACDSIVESNLTVLEPVEITINPILPAVGMGGTNGQASVTAIGGTGNYSYAWCNGETDSLATMLVGGQDCCVTITDDLGCEAIECFTVEFVTEIIPSFEADTLACFGDTDGVISFSAVDGYPPYNYEWEKNDGTINGNGTIAAAGDQVSLPNLPAGIYSVTITDIFFDTTFTVEVVEPDLVELQVVQVIDASCFNFCDGTLEVSAIGGTGNYTFDWSNGNQGALQANLCAGAYSVTATDDNGCTAEMMLDIQQPEEFIATATQTQEVSCFEGSDGQASLTTNGQPTTYDWDTGDNTPDVMGLSAGTYFVTVTNIDGCLDTTFVDITQPDEAVGVNISIATAISCAGEADGVLQAATTGPGSSFSYQWSNGSAETTAENLSTDNYSITVANEKGCEAEASFFLPEPLPINADITAVDITCLDPPNGGSILIDTVIGGTGDYTYSIDGITYSAATDFLNLEEGAYEIYVQDEQGCESIYPITVMGPPELTVTLGDDLEISQGEIIDLEAEANSNDLIYIWTPMDTLQSGSEDMLSVQPIETTVFQVIVEDTTTFCTAIDQIAVVVNRDRKIFIPNAFSPNDDGTNDLFMIQSGVGVVQVKTFRIFDRYGAMIFEQQNFLPNDPSFGWDGQLNGREMNTGVYVYVAEIEFLDGLVEVFKGDVLLMR